MSKSVYISSSEWQVSKSAIALGVLEMFSRRVKQVGVFRPLVKSSEHDTVAEALLSLKVTGSQTFEEAIGVTYDAYALDPDQALDDIVAKHSALSEKCDVVVVIGSDYDDVSVGTELDHNALIAANLNAPVIFVGKAWERTPEDIRRTVEQGVEAFEARHNNLAGIVITRADPADIDAIKEQVGSLRAAPVSVFPYDPVMAAPSVRQQFKATDAKMWLGKDEFADHESLHILAAGMTLPNVLDRLQPESTVIVPADRLDLLPGLLMAHRSSTFGPLAGIVLTGGFDMPETISRLLDGAEIDLPIALTSEDTFSCAIDLEGVLGISTASARKIELARTLFDRHVDEEALVQAIEVPRTEIRTPTMFEHQLMQLARRKTRRIVLPEATDDRILKAAAVVLQRDVAELTLLGDAAKISNRASELGIKLRGAHIVDPTEGQLLDQFSEEYAKLRAKKGVTIDQAREKMADLSYFGTMMVYLGMADGMVSGANHTTANTILPSLEFVKTKPGVSVVSGSFLMAMSSRVVVYADCAVNPDPSPAQLADIAISSAETAQTFGVDPRVAMLSYSTGTSGSGADVDKVREATKLVRERDPELKVEGPIQFDAAVDEVVAAKKMPDSEVAGRATVFIFPDLNTGNNTYKAVQRTSGAVAVGPVLQGLNKPVNDLSRGALVEDIVSTITITAIQAGQNEA